MAVASMHLGVWYNILNSKLNVRMGKKGELSVAWLLVPDGPV